MKNREIWKVVVLMIITCGIYNIYLFVNTKTEMNRLGAKIPTAWWLLLPVFGGLYWIWKYSEGVELTTKGKYSTALAFLLIFVVGPVAQVIFQLDFNQITGQKIEAKTKA
jgi:hypothetical protein